MLGLMLGLMLARACKPTIASGATVAKYCSILHRTVRNLACRADALGGPLLAPLGVGCKLGFVHALVFPTACWDVLLATLLLLLLLLLVVGVLLS